MHLLIVLFINNNIKKQNRQPSMPSLATPTRKKERGCLLHNPQQLHFTKNTFICALRFCAAIYHLPSVAHSFQQYLQKAFPRGYFGCHHQSQMGYSQLQHLCTTCAVQNTIRTNSFNLSTMKSQDAEAGGNEL